MALPTITNAPTLIDAADVTTNWTGSTLAADGTADINIDGNGSISAICRANNSSLATSGWTGFNASTAGHLRAWFQFFSLGDLNYFDLGLNSEAATFQLFSGPASNYTGGLTLKDNTYGGWFYVLIDLSGTPDTGTIPTTITSIEYYFRRVSQPRNATNTFADALHYGDGYTITGGTQGDPVTFLTIAQQDITDGAYGVVQTKQDTVYCYGAITIGSGATATYVEVKTTALLFDTQRLAAADLYSITGTGSGCTFDMQNSLIRGQSGNTGSEVFAFDMQNVGTLIFDTNTLVRANPITFGSGQNIESSTFDICGVTTTNGANINECTFIASTGTSAVLTTDLADISNCEFVQGGSNHYAVQLNSSSSANYTWNSTASGYTGLPASTGNNVGVTPTGNEVIFINDSNAGNTYNITVTAGKTIPSVASAGAVVNVNQDVTITLTNILDGSEVRVFDSEDNAAPYATPTEIAGVENLTGGVDVGGTANNGTAGGTTNANTFAFNIASGTTVYIKVFNTEFIADVIEDTYTSTQSVQINQRVDRVFNT